MDQRLHTEHFVWSLELDITESLTIGTFRYLPSGLKLSQGIPYWAVTNRGGFAKPWACVSHASLPQHPLGKMRYSMLTKRQI